MGSSSGKLTLEVVIEGIRGAVRSVSIIGGSVQAVGPGFLPRLEGPLPRDVPGRVGQPLEWYPLAMDRLGALFPSPFRLLARLRRGRSLHPVGLGYRGCLEISPEARQVA